MGDRMEQGASSRLSRLERALRDSQTGVFESARDGGDLVFDDSCLAVLGFAATDVRGDPLLWLCPLVHPDDLREVAAVLRGLASGEVSRAEREFRVRNAGGEYRNVRGICSVVEGRLVGSIQDVTSLRAEANRSEERFRALFENAPVMIDSFAEDGTCRLWNQACVEILGYTREEIEAADDPLGLFYPDEAVREAVLEAVRAGDGVFREYTVQARTGPRVQRWANYVLPGGESISVGYDVTAERRAVERLQHAQRLASIGTLAAGVAHEINNPTTYLLTNTEMSLAVVRRLLARHSDGDLQRVLEMLGDNLLGVRRIQDILRELGSFARVDTALPERVDINALVREAAHFAGSDVRHRARLELRLGEVPELVGRRKKLSQVLVNLLVNAAQAIDDGTPDDHTIAVETSFDAAADEVRIAVSDTGEGIEPEVVPRLFEPFFTTRAGRSSTGLGLALSFETVRDHGGFIDVETEPGRGSVFAVVLPRDTGLVVPAPGTVDPDAPGPRPESSPHREGRNVRVLVIDDEELVRQSLLRVLEFRYEAVGKATAQEALELLESGERFDVIFCDVMMPGVDGVGFYDRVRAEMPELLPRLVFITGGAVTERAREFTEQVDATLLVKPVGVNALFAAVEATCGRAATPSSP